VPPYTLNVCSAVALPAALADRAHYDWYRGQVDESKALLYASLDRLGIGYWRSAANFVLARFGDRLDDVVRRLGERQIAIRDRSKDPGCAGRARNTTGVVDHTRASIAALEEVLCEKAS
jgi:histidinol-phosphate aminotransferase